MVVSASGHCASERTARWNQAALCTRLPPKHARRGNLYVLEADLEELVNVVGDRPEIAGELSSVLREHIERMSIRSKG